MPYKIIGAVGLLLISLGVVTKARQTQNILFVIGGICLEIYSLYLADTIFSILQIVFIAAALADLYRVRRV